MLFWTAVINGVVAVPIMVAMMWIVTRGRPRTGSSLPGWIRILGWLATLLMALAVAPAGRPGRCH